MDDERRERKRKRDRMRYWKDREKRLEYAKAYYRKNRQKCIERVRLSEYKRMTRNESHISG